MPIALIALEPLKSCFVSRMFERLIVAPDLLVVTRLPLNDVDLLLILPTRRSLMDKAMDIKTEDANLHLEAPPNVLAVLPPPLLTVVLRTNKDLVLPKSLLLAESATRLCRPRSWRMPSCMLWYVPFATFTYSTLMNYAVGTHRLQLDSNEPLCAAQLRFALPMTP